jgi:5-formyltetrahydrofolate cyclo-ligase
VIFDPDLESLLRRQAKVELRKRMKAMRRSIPPKALAARGEKIVQHVTTSRPFVQARAVGLFWPMLHLGEVDVRPLDQAARAAGKLVAYPSLDNEVGMTLRCAPSELLEDRGHGFAEPPANAPEVDISSDLVVIVPALAVDLSGHRVGYGRGFYDRLLARIAPPAFAMAVAYDFQVVAEVPRSEHDRPVNMLVTDVRTAKVEV